MLRTAVLEQNDDVSNGRFDIWNQYINTFNNNPILWFIGIGDFKKHGIEMMAHNFLIEDIANYGIVGCTLLYSCCILTYRKLKRRFSSKNSYYLLLPFFIPIIGGITLHGMTNIINISMLFIGYSLYASYNSNVSTLEFYRNNNLRK